MSVKKKIANVQKLMANLEKQGKLSQELRDKIYHTHGEMFGFLQMTELAEDRLEQMEIEFTELVHAKQKKKH